MSSSSSSSSTSKVAAVVSSKQSDNKVAAVPVVLVTGASRGIGYGLALEFATKFGYRVIATARTPATAKQLNDFAKTHSNLQVAPLDVADEKSIRALPAVLRAAPYSLDRIDILINNAGVLSKGSPKETVANAQPANLREVLETNLVGPLLTSQVLLPFLRASTNARLINVSSTMGSIKLAQDGTYFPFVEPSYRISKAALNMLSALQASEFNFGLPATGTAPAIDPASAKAQAATAAVIAQAAKPASAKADGPILPPGFLQPSTHRITVVAWHPGYVASDMGTSAGGKPDLTPEGCAAVFAPVVHALAPSNTVVFVDEDGKKALPW